jgi:hypothetical protein
MQHPYYQDSQNFSPSRNTLDLWLKTRKTDNNSKPGLIETIDYSRDLAWSIFSILIEFSAFFLTLFGAWTIYRQEGNLILFITALIFVVVFIGLDIIGIMLHSQDKPQKVLDKSEAAITHNPIQKEILLKKINSITNRTFIGVILLCISSLLKIIAVSVFFKESGVAGTIVLMIFYMVVVYIHMYHTGYWWAARKVQKRINSEFLSYINSQNTGTTNPYQVTQPNIQLFSSPFPMDNGRKKLQSNRQTVEFLDSWIDQNGTSMFNYQLTTNGLMWDSDVNQIITYNNHNFNQYLIEACIRLQLSQLGQIVVAPPFNINSTVQNSTNHPAPQSTTDSQINE